ncbi:MAG: hypothetical protein ACM31O_03970 [Bacteroidota bacterium]
MTDWKRGGWTGSLNGWVRREIQEHFRENPIARRTRYSFGLRALHRVFDDASFLRFVAIYAAFALLTGLAEVAVAAYAPHWIPRWAGNEIKQFLTNVASYLISAQVSALGVISIAIGLVTIIAQRENASTDVQVYYHESLSFGLVASSIALLTVLCAQLLWPVQFTVHWFGHGTGLLFFKALLTVVHMSWMLLNLAGLAHFVATTLAFVQQKAREQQREQYTTNVVVPVEMRRRLREQLFLMAGPGFVKEACLAATAGNREPTVYLGNDFDGAGAIEIPLKVRKGVVLADVRMVLVRWAVCRWLRRCVAAHNDQQERVSGLTHEPLLLFPPRLDTAPEPQKGLCRRRGGVPMTRMERLVLRYAFKFRRKRDEP